MKTAILPPSPPAQISRKEFWRSLPATSFGCQALRMDRVDGLFQTLPPLDKRTVPPEEAWLLIKRDKTSSIEGINKCRDIYKLARKEKECHL